MKKKVKKTKKTKKVALKEFLIPVIVTVSGHITVKAVNFKQALQKAQEDYMGQQSIEMPCVDTEWCETEDDANDYERRLLDINEDDDFWDEGENGVNDWGDDEGTGDDDNEWW